MNFADKVEKPCACERGRAHSVAAGRARGAGGPDTRRVFRAAQGFGGSLFVGRSRDSCGASADDEPRERKIARVGAIGKRATFDARAGVGLTFAVEVTSRSFVTHQFVEYNGREFDYRHHRRATRARGTKLTPNLIPTTAKVDTSVRRKQSTRHHVERCRDLGQPRVSRLLSAFNRRREISSFFPRV